MNNNNSGINFIGLTSFRNQKKKFGIKPDDRRRHFYTIGKTGMGKSNLMENMAIQDIQQGRGIAYVDPHGEGAEKLLLFVPPEKIKDVVFFNPADLDYPIAFNVMEKVDFKYRHLVAGGLMGVFKKVWPDVWSARMEYILNNSILALLEYPDSTLLGINRMLADPEYRAKVVAKVKDPIVKSFWVTEYSRYTQRYEVEATAAIQNKVGQFVSNALIRNIIGQIKSTIDMRKIMDEGRILILDLSKGRIGEDNSRLLGALLITKLQLAAMSRVDISEEERKDFYLYVDEFQNFATESFANILSEARKYRLNLIIGHQYISQMEDVVRDAVFGNVGTMAVFRVGAEDAEFLEKEFTPEFMAEDLVNLPKYNIYLKLMIDGIASHPFSAETLPPPVPLEDSNKDKIIRASRERYAVRRELVEEKISRWTEGDKKEEKTEEKKKIAPVSANIQQEQTVLYDAICSKCGKRTKVVFPPDGQKPIYCRSCLKKIKGKTVGVQEKNQPLEIKNIPFRAPKLQLNQESSASVSSSILSKARIELEQKQKQLKPKRKEINLSELKKALDESLVAKEKEPAVKDANEDKIQENASQEPAEVQKSPDEKQEQEKQKKGVIEPGQKISF